MNGRNKRKKKCQTASALASVRVPDAIAAAHFIHIRFQDDTKALSIHMQRDESAVQRTAGALVNLHLI